MYFLPGLRFRIQILALMNLAWSSFWCSGSGIRCFRPLGPDSGCEKIWIRIRDEHPWIIFPRA
jgi:hypothetical protein